MSMMAQCALEYRGNARFAGVDLSRIIGETRVKN
jgi:hypothetical protein